MSGRQIVIVGGIAGGMSCATRLRRLDEQASIVMIEWPAHVSDADCALPSFVGGVMEDEDDLLVMTPERLHERLRLDVRVHTEVTAIDTMRRTVTVRASDGHGGTSEIAYDALVLSPGAAPVRPDLPGFHRVAILRSTEEAKRVAERARERPRSAVVIGAGFVGLEAAENLASRGIRTSVVEAAPQVLTPFDPELAVLVEAELLANGVRVETGVGVAEVDDTGVMLTDGRVVAGDLVVAAVVVRPDVRLAELAGLALGPGGGIAVDDHGCTSEPGVYAVGDAAEKADSAGGGSSLVTLANITNRQGRRVADHICGRSDRPMASVGTAIVRVFGFSAALTGWNERRLRAAGRPYRVVHSHPMSHACSYPDAEPMALKLLFDPDDGTILGAQAVGGMGVDKRIDVLATAMAAGLGAQDLAVLELACAPAFSPATDPLNMLGYMAENVVLGECDVIGASDLNAALAEGWTVLDVRSRDEHRRCAIPHSVNAPLEVLCQRLVGGFLGTGPFVVYCEVGQRGQTAAALLHERGFVARNLDGGYRTWRAVEAARAGDPEQVVSLRAPV